MKIQNKDRYKVGSYCARCNHLTPEPSNIIWDLAVGIAPNSDIDRHPEIKLGKVYYDEKGWKHNILARIKITRLDRRKKVFCEHCGKQCRAGSYSKTGAKNHYIPSDKPVGRPKGSKTRIKTKEEIAQTDYNEKQYFEQLQRKMNLNREAIIDTPDENLTLVERIMKHDRTYWRILAREIKKQIKQDSLQDNLNPARKETQRGSRFMSNYYAEDKYSKHDKFDIKSFREELFRQWQELNKRFERNKKKNLNNNTGRNETRETSYVT